MQTIQEDTDDFSTKPSRTSIDNRSRRSTVPRGSYGTVPRGSFAYKKFSMRMSLKSVEALSRATTALIKGMGRPVNTAELGPKCFKYSPRVAPLKVTPTIQKHDFEMNKWQETFNSMGRLLALKKPEDKTVITFGKAPYHCGSHGRDFASRYGQLSQVKTTPERQTTSEKVPPWLKKEPPDFCHCMENFLYGRVMNSKDTFGKNVLPKSCVSVRWGYSEEINDKRYAVEEICEWLYGFGTVVFTVMFGKNKMLVAYETIRAAQKAVKYNASPSIRIIIDWWDPKFNNYGHFNLYRVTT